MRSQGLQMDALGPMPGLEVFRDAAAVCLRVRQGVSGVRIPAGRGAGLSKDLTGFFFSFV